MAVSDLADETYVSLETFKRDGSGVKTAVWVAPLDGKMVIFTDGTSFKVKRLRRNAAVRVAACDVRGVTTGPWAEGTGAIIDSPDREAQAYRALREKYGLQMRVVDLFSWLAGRIDRRVVLEVTLRDVVQSS